MKNAMQKDFWREIQHTRSRFFSIMIRVALSVAFPVSRRPRRT